MSTSADGAERTRAPRMSVRRRFAALFQLERYVARQLADPRARVGGVRRVVIEDELAALRWALATLARAHPDAAADARQALDRCREKDFERFRAKLQGAQGS